MKMYTLTREQFINRPINKVFALFENPENLELITPPFLKFVIFSPRPIQKKAGTVIDFSIRILGIRMHWRTLISDYEPPYRFVDVQLKGPYTFWHHTHTFDELDHGVLMVDEIRYILPFGIIGRLVHALLVKRKIEMIFDYRARVVERIFGGSGKGTSRPPKAAANNADADRN